MRGEQLHAVVARSTFPSQNIQNTPGPDHFWQLRCRKSARRCGAKHISKSKCTKHTILGPLLEVEMSKKCTPLWREAHFEVNMYKTHHSRTTFGSWDVEKVHAVVARSTFRGSDHFWRFRCRNSARLCGAKHISKSKGEKNTRGVRPLLEVQMSLRVAGARDCAPCQKWAKRVGFVAFSTTTTTTPHYTPTLQYITLQLRHTTTTTTPSLHSTTLHSTTLHCTQLHSITLHYTTLHYTTLHYTTLPSTTLHYFTLHYTPQHYNYNYTTTLTHTPLHSTTLHYITLHSTTLQLQLQLQLHNYTPLPLHYTTLHYTTLHYTTFHYTSLHYTTLHSTTLQLQLQLHNYTPLHYTSLHYTTLHSTTLQLQLQNYTPLHYATLNYTTLHYTPLHSTTLHYITLHYIPLHSTTLYTLHYITLHWITLNDTAPQIDR